MDTKICQQTNVAEIDNSAVHCDGYTSDDCIIHEEAIAYLSLPADSSIKDVVDKILLSLADSRNRIIILESDLVIAIARIAAIEEDLLQTKNRILILETN